ncbi:protein of unknown function [Ruminococcaceae bacterium BL-6]|nr:protein of unknown function [Ruminococcaceae bacterium BL-6]
MIGQAGRAAKGTMLYFKDQSPTKIVSFHKKANKDLFKFCIENREKIG